jgi:hypothetical protein
MTITAAGNRGRDRFHAAVTKPGDTSAAPAFPCWFFLPVFLAGSLRSGHD